MTNPLLCDRCRGELESDDAISIIEGVCAECRRRAESSQTPASRQAAVDPRVQSFYPPPTHPDIQRKRIVPRRIIAPIAVTPAPIRSASEIGETQHSIRGRRRRRDLAIGMTVGVVLSGGVGLAIWSQLQQSVQLTMQDEPRGQVPIRLTVKPPWATVMVDGRSIGAPDKNGQLTIDLPASGESMRWLEVSAPGHHSIRRPLSVLGGVGNVSVELLQQPYDLAVKTTPPDAEVWINGELKGYSPLTLAMLPWEKTTLMVKRSGYQAVSRDVKAPEAGGRLEMDLKLQAGPPVLQVESTPPGATVTVDGKPRGKTPAAIELTGDELGKTVDVLASLEGYEPAHLRLPLPTNTGEAIAPAKFSLLPLAARIHVETEPPGAKVFVDGALRGVSPMVATFPPDQVGKTCLIEAVLPSSEGQRQQIMIPAVDKPATIRLAMNIRSERVVFLLWSASPTWIDHFNLLKELKDRIHALTPDQRFAVLSLGDEGIDAWPAASTTEQATAEQKVRAYDRLAGIRPHSSSSLTELLRVSAAMKPQTVWLFAAGQINRAELREFGEAASRLNASFHIVRTSSGPEDDWIQSWAASHRGTLTILGRDDAPKVAFENESDH
jgi:hypothetical protein